MYVIQYVCEFGVVSSMFFACVFQLDFQGQIAHIDRYDQKCDIPQQIGSEPYAEIKITHQDTGLVGSTIYYYRAQVVAKVIYESTIKSRPTL